MDETSEPLTRRALNQETERLHEELTKLREKVEEVSGTQEVTRPEWPSETPEKTSVTREDFERQMGRVWQDLADLALATNRLTHPAAPDEPRHRHTRRVSQREEVYQIELNGPVRNRTITLQNRGADVVVNPRIVVNGRRDWFSTESILEEVLRPDMSDRERAVAIWAFLRDNRIHGCPAHNDIEMHDPVRYLNVYGYGFCDDSATVFAVLARQAGLKARVWSLNHHVVAEAYFDGDWHMLDPDGEIYYLDDDGETISSVETLEQRPDIIRKYPSPQCTDTDNLVRIYTTTDDNKVSTWYDRTSEAVHTMAYALRPGESLMRSWDNWGKYFSSRFLDEPERYGNGRFTFKPIFENGLFRKGADCVRNIRVAQGGQKCRLAPALRDRPGVLIYRFESPYPFLDGAVSLRGTLDGEAGLELAFSETGDEWRTVWSADGPGPVEAAVPTGGYFRNGYGRPMYAYNLRFSLSESENAAVRLEELSVRSDVQVAPGSLPALEAGENKVRYLDETPGQRDVEITFAYDHKSDEDAIEATGQEK